MDELIKTVISYLKLKWHRKSSIVVLVLFVVVLMLLFFSAVKIEEISKTELLIGCCVLGSVVVIWFYTRSVPKSAKGKIGFALGIKSEDPKQHQKITRDFAQKLKELLLRSQYRYGFDFVEIPDYVVDKIFSIKDAERVLQDTGCSFMVYGTARTVTINGQMQHILDLEGAVTHKPVSEIVHKSLSKEFSELFPRKLKISSEGDLFHFEFTAKWIDLVSRYIIGIAALISGDINYSKELFEELQASLSKNVPDLPSLVKIRQRLPQRLKDVYLYETRAYYIEWKRTRNISSLSSMKSPLDKLVKMFPENPDGKIFLSMWYFVVKNDVASAKKQLLSMKGKRQEAIWKYNYAFLLAYEGQLEKATIEYKKAVHGYVPEPDFVFEIIEFIMWAINSEPEKTQLHFCLGIIYFYAIQDYTLALSCFEKFIETTPPGRFSRQIKDAKESIDQINKKKLYES